MRVGWIYGCFSLCPAMRSRAQHSRARSNSGLMVPTSSHSHDRAHIGLRKGGRHTRPAHHLQHRVNTTCGLASSHPLRHNTLPCDQEREHTLQNTKRWSRIRSTHMRLASTEQCAAHTRPNSPVAAALATHDAHMTLLCTSPAPQRLSSNR